MKERKGQGERKKEETLCKCSREIRNNLKEKVENDT